MMMTGRMITVLFLLTAALVSHSVSGKEASHEGHDHDHEHEHDLDHLILNDTKSLNETEKKKVRWEPYVYGTISVSIVSLLALIGRLVIPFVKNQVVYDGVMLMFMALAVGTMTSDAILHLVPETMGLDSHGHGGNDGHEHEHEHEHGEEEGKSYLGKLIALLGILYGLYMLELLMHTVGRIMKKPKIHEVENGKIPAHSSAEKTSPTSSKFNTGIQHHGHSHSHIPDGVNGGHTILGLKPVAFVVILSGAMHSFTDGLAIGTAYTKSSAAGLGVSIAVICHEVPHEIGNFAILLNTGMSLKKALLLNFLQAAASLIGLYPGIVAGEQEALAQWIFAAVAAGFLYVALVHMLRELQSFGSLPWWLSIILQNFGMLLGFVIIYLLAIYEDALNGLA